MANVHTHAQASLTLSGREAERRLGDRRRQATPMWSRFTLHGGKRRGGRRRSDDLAVFVDLYGPRLFGVLVAIVGLNVLDAWFTLFFLSYGGTELNPIVRAILPLGVMPFVLLKSVGIGVCVMFLALTKNFRPARIGMGVVLLGYLALAFWHLYLLEWLEV